MENLTAFQASITVICASISAVLIVNALIDIYIRRTPWILAD